METERKRCALDAGRASAFFDLGAGRIERRAGSERHDDGLAVAASCVFRVGCGGGVGVGQGMFSGLGL